MASSTPETPTTTAALPTLASCDITDVQNVLQQCQGWGSTSKTYDPTKSYAYTYEGASGVQLAAGGSYGPANPADNSIVVLDGGRITCATCPEPKECSDTTAWIFGILFGAVVLAWIAREVIRYRA